jgi:hypothetical protein
LQNFNVIDCVIPEAEPLHQHIPITDKKRPLLACGDRQKPIEPEGPLIVCFMLFMFLPFVISAKQQYTIARKSQNKFSVKFIPTPGQDHLLFL